MIYGSGESKSRLTKAAGVEPCGHMRDEHFHGIIVRSTQQSKNVQSTLASEQFSELRCRTSAPRGGAQHILKSKASKN